MTAVANKGNNFLADFAAAEKHLPGRELDWLRQLRSEALRRWEALGFPSTRHEAWRFTNVTPIADTRFTLAAKQEITRQEATTAGIPGLDTLQLTFVNGRYVPTLSTLAGLPTGVKVGPLGGFLKTHAADLEKHLGQNADVREHPFVALNTAFFADGAHIYIPKGIVVQTPIHLLFVSNVSPEPTVAHPRVLVVAEQDSQATIVESYSGATGADRYWTNVVSEIVLGENARLDHYRIERESVSAFHTSTLQVRQARSSNFTSRTVLIGGAIVRNTINVTLAGEGAECALDGLYMGAGRQLLDTHTWIDHAKPHCTSREYYKGILDERSHGVFDGHVVVRQDAQKTDAVQANKNLLLSNEAVINTKPELKIFANDVKCKHGATIGQINAEALFYLRSRGIPQSEARKLLIYAFASEMINQIPLAPLREALASMLFEKFQGSAR